MFWLKKIFHWLLPTRKKIVPWPHAKASGLLKGVGDERDFSITPSDVLTMAPSFNLKTVVSRVENQGGYNSCVAQSITTAIESMAKLHDWNNVFELSRMHLWNNARQETWGEEKWTRNVGVRIRDAWKVAQKRGVTLEKLFPYQPAYSSKKLHDTFVFAWYPSFNYYWITPKSHEERALLIKQVLQYRKTPIVFGIRVTDSFKIASGNKVYEPVAGEAKGFAHAMLIIGWSDAKDAFLIMNSWGRAWGHHGFLWVKKSWLLGGAFDLSYCDNE